MMDDDMHQDMADMDRRPEDRYAAHRPSCPYRVEPSAQVSRQSLNLQFLEPRTGPAGRASRIQVRQCSMPKKLRATKPDMSTENTVTSYSAPE